MEPLNALFHSFNVSLFRGRSVRGTFIFPALLLIGCNGSGKAGHANTTQDVTSPVPSEEPAPASIDTLWGYVGEGTSMHLIELVSADAADTMLLELEDEADHRATLTVGNEICVALQQQPDGQQIVLATFDADSSQP